uniref:Enoyl reductase (ER) domain-containing protein n=1 Tax=Craspedostauros australis TaxID=1486917 RepID=A0A7R9WWX8_9STRA|mmetsp:Transcript_23694/g.66175  ORF Transcript_23694/g.66175 Transcript_23694/m.66175 type:complete len:380 (+) Transcript_23694:75-1214(+)|eukprot:CAMPEP_0198119440 /NCGR_PEP_ID=MMETSP1442-20131203/25595_1 /TAXON_ID= /ORGANISM="Craspedostauros australis, Strain CCMP3328" /LENGTH=379 /DNA_ID=CAMNT_0043777909 /DNA_START=63 /DNA_END=1202 /DNA_ORIENTATION=+
MIFYLQSSLSFLTIALASSANGINNSNNSDGNSRSNKQYHPSAMTTMKRVDLIKQGGFAPNKNLATVDVDVPKPSDMEVLIDIKASAINPVDWKIASFGFMLPPQLPATLGCDVAGIVEDGPDTMKGKRVVTYLGADKTNTKTTRGAFVDKVLADKDIVFEIPDSMSFAEAASQPVGGLAAVLLLDSLVGVKPGDWVLVWGGSSSVGFHAVQLAKARGYKVIAVTSAKHEQSMKDLGADGFADYRKGDVEAQVDEIMKGQATGLNGAADCIGNANGNGAAARLVKKYGKTDASLVISTVDFGMPAPPDGVEAKMINLGAVLGDPESRKDVVAAYPSILELKPQAIRLVKGKMSADTVAKALQINKDGVSGEKVIIEWEK